MKIKYNLPIFIFSCLAQQKQPILFNGYPGILSYHNYNTSRHKTKLQKEIYFKSIREHLHLNKVITGVLQKEKKNHGMKFFFQIFEAKVT